MTNKEVEVRQLLPAVVVTISSPIVVSLGVVVAVGGLVTGVMLLTKA